MGDRLVVDLDALAQTSEHLAKIANEFDDTDTVVNLVTEAIGSRNETHELRAAVEHFAGTWRIRREKVRDSVRYLSQTAAAVAEHLSNTDQGLASNLSSSGPGPTPAAAASGIERRQVT